MAPAARYASRGALRFAALPTPPPLKQPTWASIRIPGRPGYAGPWNLSRSGHDGAAAAASLARSCGVAGLPGHDPGAWARRAGRGHGASMGPRGQGQRVRLGWRDIRGLAIGPSAAGFGKAPGSAVVARATGNAQWPRQRECIWQAPGWHGAS